MLLPGTRSLLLGAAILAPIASCSSEDGGERELGVRGAPELGVRGSVAANMGRALFFDRALSASGNQACGDCHIPQFAFADTSERSRGIGVDARRRNAPTLFNVGLLTHFGWDGRFGSLEEQAASVFTVRGDAGITLDSAVALIASRPAYWLRSVAAFGARPSAATVLRALAAYERTLVSGNAPIDRYLLTDESNPLSGAQRRGLALFNGKAQCISCHPARIPVADSDTTPLVLFTDLRFHNLGVGALGSGFSDSGRFTVTGVQSAIGAFRTPSLRNVAITAPYMHDGSLPTLEDVVRFYEAGGRKNRWRDAAVRSFTLTDQERGDLISFLRSLTSQGTRRGP